MAAGGELIIDNKLLKLLDNVDKKLEKIAKTSGSAQANIFKMFDKTGSQGVDGLIRKLQQLEKYYSTIGQNDSRGMKRIANDARKTADEINKLIAAVQQRWTPNFKGAMDYSQNAKNLSQDREAINRLRQARETLSRADSEYFKKLSQINGAIAVHSSRLRMATGASREMSKAHRGLMDISGQLTRKLALVFSVSQIEGYMNKLVNVRREFELQKRSLEVLLRDHHEANKLWNQTVQLAVKSPFRVKQLVTYTKQLAAYRIETDKLHDTTKMLADVSAGLGVDMNRLILAYGQVRAAEFLRGTELRQFTEAGIPMLEELADHFTKLEGRAVSTADVFDRISKRMVKFEDVAEVFKRITSEGGTFYKMQEKQAETLDGQISNLHDAIDLMLNDIGAAQDGLMKNMIAATRNIVENWRAIASVMEVVGVSLSLKIVSLFARGFMAATAHATLATKSLHGVALAGAKVNVMFQTLTKKIVAHPWITLGAAILVAGKAVWDYSRAIDANNKKYDELSNAEIARIDRLKQIQSEVEKNNKAIKENADNTKEQADAQKKNNVLLEELKTKFPEIYQGLVKQKDGTLEVSKAIEQQNQLLYINIALQQQAKGGVFQQDYQKNYSQAVEAYSKMQTQLVDIQNAATQASAKLALVLGKGEIPSQHANEIEEILGQIRKTTTIEEAFKFYRQLGRMEARAFQSAFGDTITSVIHGVNAAFSEANNEVASYRMALADFLQNIDNQISSYQLGVGKFMESGDTEGAKQWIDTQLEALGTVDKAIKQEAREHIVQKIGVKLVWENQPEKEWTEADFKQEWQRVLWNAIKDVQDTNPNIQLGVTVAKIAKADTEEAKKAIFESLDEPVKQAIQSNKQTLSALNDEQVRYTKEQVKQIQASTKPLEHLQKVMALYIKKPKDEGKDWFSEMGKAIMDTHKDFLTLHKDLDETRALELAMEKHSDVFAEAAKGAKMIGLSLRDFSGLLVEDNAIAALEDLLGRIPETASKSRLAIKKMFGGLKGGEEVRETQERFEELNNQIEKLFGTYELSFELKDMNMPTDLAERLFNFKSIDLSELRQKALDELGVVNQEGTDAEIIERLKKGDASEERIKLTKDTLKKISDMEAKALEERMKKYAKFLEQEQTERVKIKLNEVRQLMEIEDTFRIHEKDARETYGLSNDQWKAYEKQRKTGQEINLEFLKGLGIEEERAQAILEQNRLLAKQKQLAYTGVNRTTQEQLDKDTWESFKKSGYYEMMFSDLEHLGTKAIDSLYEKLSNMQDALKQLPPEVYKEIQSTIDKIESVKLERNPFEGLIDAWKEVRDLNKNGIDIDIADPFFGVSAGTKNVKGEEEIAEEYARQEARLTLLREEEAIVAAVLAVKQGTATIDQQQLTQTQEAQGYLDKQESDLNVILKGKQKEKNLTEQNAKALKNGVNAYQGMSKAVSASWKKTGQWAEAIKNTADATDALLDSLGVAKDSAARIAVQAVSMTADMILNVVQLQIQFTAAGIAANGMLGIIGWIAMGLQAVAKIFTFIFGLHDAKLQKEIEHIEDKVESLRKAFEKLEKQMESAYSTDSIKQNTDEMLKNLEDQAAAYEKMAELEQEKKDTDKEKVEEYLEEREKALEEREKMLIEREKAFGGFGGQEDYKSASEEFVDAWLSAFKETGNGLEGLNDKFEEFFLNMVKKQLATRVMEKYMNSFYDFFDDRLSDDGELLKKEREEIKDEWSKTAAEASAALQALLESMGVASDIRGKAEMDTLQKGIQGITETQADIIASYLNSIRFFVAEQNSYLQDIAMVQGVSQRENPMVEHLKVVAEQTTAIHNLLDNLLAPHPTQAGRGLKVVI